MDSFLAAELLSMAQKDHQVRQQLAADGSLYDGYHPMMKAVHDEHALQLTQIIEQVGWPGKSLVGEEGAHAAWLILQHAIGHPDLQRKCLTVLKPLMHTGEVSAVDVAKLEDRIRTFEGKPQLFGTQFDWDEKGEMSPLSVDDPILVDERRKALGLESLLEATENMRRYVRQANVRPPANYQKHKKEGEAWLKATGWRH